MQVAKQRDGAFVVHQGIDGVFEKDRVVFLQRAGVEPNLVQGDLFLCPDEPVYAALEGIAVTFPAGGNPTRIGGFFQDERLNARTLQIDSGGKPRNASSDNYGCLFGHVVMVMYQQDTLNFTCKNTLF